MKKDTLTFRDTIIPADIENVRRILNSSGFFREAEIDVAIELVEETLEKGDSSGYLFIFLEQEGETIGYTCFGEIPCTVLNFDLYWIAVDERFRGHGFGRMLMKKTENTVKSMCGRGIYIETSEKEQYKPTMAFYKSSGYDLLYVFRDFYDTGDHKAVFYKKL
jgi:GNAT superfamily N-acetyltransferase